MDEGEDKISSPSHYLLPSGCEVLEIIQDSLSEEELKGYYTGNIIKYLLRYKKKNGLEDLKKAQKYLQWIIDEVEYK